MIRKGCASIYSRPMKKFILGLGLVTSLLLTACTDSDRDDASIEAEVDVDAEKIERNLENAGRELKEAGNEAMDKLEDAGDKIENKLDDAGDRLDDDKKIEVEVKKD